MKKLVFVFVCSLQLGFFCAAQYDPENLKSSITNDEALLSALNKARPGVKRIQLLLELGSLYLSKPAPDDKDLDNGFKYTQEALEQSTALSYNKGRIGSLMLLGKFHLLKDDLPAAKNILKQVSDTSRIRFLMDVTEYYWSNSDRKGYLDTAMLHAEQIIKLSEAAGRPDMKAEGMIHKAIVYYFRADINKAEEWFAEVIKLGKTGVRVDMQYVYGQLLAMNFTKGDLQKVILYSIEAMKVIAAEGETDEAGVIYLNTAVAYKVLREFDKAVELYKRSCAFSKKKGQNSVFWSSVRELVGILLALNKDEEALAYVENAKAEMPPKDKPAKFYMNSILGNCYRKLKKSDLAETHFRQALNFSRNSEFSHAGYTGIANYYIETKKFELAKPYLDTMMSNMTARQTRSNLSNLHRMFYKVDSALGNYRSALEHLRESKLLDDSIFQATKTKQMQELQVQYETEKKDADIRLKGQNILLLTRQTELQQKDFEQTRLRFQYDSQAREQSFKLMSSEAARKDKDILLKEQNIELLQKEGQLKQSSLKQANLTRNVTFAVIGMLAIIMLLLYYQYRVKKRSNKEISKKNQKLEQLVEEKGWLVKEIHHRVKNNLQTVVSLLESQSAYLEDDALKAVQNSQHRVHAMSLIHQKLYQAEDMSSINMSVYLPELVNYLSDSFQAGQRVKFHFNIENIELDVSQAIPVGLIVNEAITNALKYAFRSASNNEIRISMHSKTDGKIELTIADNGISLPADFQHGKTNSLGIKLMRGLTDDIGGEFSITSTNGTLIKVIFTNDPIIQQVKKMAANKI